MLYDGTVVGIIALVRRCLRRNISIDIFLRRYRRRHCRTTFNVLQVSLPCSRDLVQEFPDFPKTREFPGNSPFLFPVPGELPGNSYREFPGLVRSQGIPLILPEIPTIIWLVKKYFQIFPGKKT